MLNEQKLKSLVAVAKAATGKTVVEVHQ